MRCFNQYGYTKLSRLSLHFIRSHNGQNNIKITQEIQSTENGLAYNGIKFEQTFREVCSLIKKIFRMETVVTKRAEQIISTLKGHQQRFTNR